MKSEQQKRAQRAKAAQARRRLHPRLTTAQIAEALGPASSATIAAVLRAIK